MRIISLIITLCTGLHLSQCQSCKPHPKGSSLEEVAVKSTFVVRVLPHIDQSVTKDGMHNITAKVKGAFDTHNGINHPSVRFGPVGNSNGCTKLKSNTEYIAFLQESTEDRFYWITFNPVKATKKAVRSLRKVLCQKCLVPVSFKRKSKTYKKKEGKKLKIRCKASGKPRASIVWFHNDNLLTKHNTPKEIKIKTNRRGGSSSLEIKKVTMAYNGDHFTCSASNIASDSSANFTAILRISKAKYKCTNPCPKSLDSFCARGKCCMNSLNQPYCVCPEKYTGPRCKKKNLNTVIASSISDERRHQERLVAVLGVCLSLMVVLFICMGVYCLFKNKRKAMHHKLGVDGHRSEASSPMLPLHNDVENATLNSKDVMTHDNMLGAHVNDISLHSNFFNVPTVGEVSSSSAVFNDSSQVNSQPSVAIRRPFHANINGSTRSRLNGKSGPHRSSAKFGDGGSRKPSRSSTSASPKQQGIAEADHLTAQGQSKMSSCHDSVNEQPFNCNLSGLEKHQSSHVVSETSPPQTSFSSHNNHTFTTLRREDDDISYQPSSQAHSFAYPNFNNENRNASQFAYPTQSPIAPRLSKPIANCTPCDTYLSDSSYSSHQDVEKSVPQPESSKFNLSAGSYVGDPLKVVEIPGMSFDFDGNIPSQGSSTQQMLQRQQAIDSEEHRCPQPVLESPIASASIVSACLLLSSKQTLSMNETVESCDSVLSSLSSLSDDGRNSLQIEV